MTNATSLILPSMTSVVLYAWVAASLYALFRKAGEQGWKGWVPIVNGVTLLRLGGLSGWWYLLAIVPFVGAAALYALTVVACHRVGRSFGRGAGMTVLAALLFPVWSSVLGWGSDRWLGGIDRDTVPAHAPRRAAAPARTLGPGSPLYPRGDRETASGAGRPVVAPPFAPSPADAAPGVSVPAPRALVDEEAGLDDDRPYDDRRPSPLAGVVAVPEVAPRRAAAPAEPAAGGERWAAPMSGVPGVVAAREPWAPPPPVDARHTPLLSPMPTGTDGGFSDTSAEVSAVASAPSVGAPLSARSSVSARRRAPEIPGAEFAVDETIVASRRRVDWMLVPPLGAPVAVTSDVLILGRRPVADTRFPDAQLIALLDETRTVSKTHARLERRADGWTIVDLDSTNGVVLQHDDGSETEPTPGIPVAVGERFLLGDAVVRLTRDADA